MSGESPKPRSIEMCACGLNGEFSGLMSSNLPLILGLLVLEEIFCGSTADDDDDDGRDDVLSFSLLAKCGTIRIFSGIWGDPEISGVNEDNDSAVAVVDDGVNDADNAVAVVVVVFKIGVLLLSSSFSDRISMFSSYSSLLLLIKFGFNVGVVDDDGVENVSVFIKFSGNWGDDWCWILSKMSSSWLVSKTSRLFSSMSCGAFSNVIGIVDGSGDTLFVSGLAAS